MLQDPSPSMLLRVKGILFYFVYAGFLREVHKSYLWCWIIMGLHESISRAQFEIIRDSVGHMLHIEEPEQLTQLALNFF
jgi:hypothetical protein